MPCLDHLETLIQKRSLLKALWSCAIGLTLLCFVSSSWNSAYAQSSQPLFPKYIVMGVVYAPPGSASSVTYGSTEFVGSSDSFSTLNSSETISTTSFTAGATLGLFGASITYNNTNQWTTSSQHTSSVAIQTTDGNAISTMGPISSALGVNHDNDIIYIWLNPVASMVVTGTSSLNWTNLSSNSCDPTDTADVLTFYQQISGCDPNQYPYPDIVGIPVWCLKNPYYPGQGCAQWLPYTSRSWDLSPWGTDSNGNPLGPQLTLQDYADILQADPFVSLNGNSVNVCHPTYNADLDPNDVEVISSTPVTLTGSQVNPARLPLSCGAGGTLTRFLPYGVVEYPEPGPNGLPSTYSGNFQYSQTNTAGTTATDTHTAGQSTEATASFGISFGIFSADAAFSASNATWLTLQNQSAFTNTTGTTQYANYSITGPQLSDNYTGPATYNVYFDNVYGTYAFYSDLETKPTVGNIGISTTSTGTTAIPNFGQVTVGTASTPPKEIWLTNNSTYPLTVVWPAVTFTDPGFQLVEGNGSYPDNCSNQALAASAQCTLWVDFAPVASDVANTPYGSTQPINATMIAAGTENAFSYENILVTNNAAVSGTAAPVTTQVATLFPNPIQNTTITCPPPAGKYCASQNIFSFATYVSTAETQAFTFTNYFTSSVAVTGFALTDSQNFTVISNGCTTVPAPPSTSNTCAITLQFKPVTGIPPGGVYNTKITAMGNVVGATIPAIPLTVAGAAGTLTGSLSVSPSTYTVDFNEVTYTCGSTPPCPTDTGGWDYTVYNGTSYALTINASCSNPVPPGGTCIVPLTVSCVVLEYETGICGSAGYTATGTTSGGTKYTANSVSLTADIVANNATKSQIILTGAEQSKTDPVPATYAKATIKVDPLKTPVAGKGTLSVTVGTFEVTVSYAAGATDDTVAKALVTDLNGKGSPVKATRSGAVITLKAVDAGTTGNIALETTGDAIFELARSSKTLTGGKDATTTTKYDGGGVDVTTYGVTASTTWGKESTAQTVAKALATSINKVAGTYWKATASGDVITLTVVSHPSASTSGPAIAVAVTDSEGFTPPSFGAQATN
ncbi:MAG: hypothetical protein ABSF93_00195 [Candidatus Sulfotelmatobacter sp.]